MRFSQQPDRTVTRTLQMWPGVMPLLVTLLVLVLQTQTSAQDEPQPAPVVDVAHEDNATSEDNAASEDATADKDGKRPRVSFVPKFKAKEFRPHVEFLASDELRGRSGQGARAAARYVEDHFKELKLLPLFNGQYQQKIPGSAHKDGSRFVIGQNVGAWLPGSDPELRDEFVIVSAHYDHLGVRGGKIYHGADDNASGTSMVLEVARRFASLEKRPARSMVFLAFDLEEHLLWGSRWFVAHAPWKMEQVKLFMTADMIGRSLGGMRIDTVFVMGSEHGSTLDETLDTIGEPAGLNVARLGIDLIGSRSDYAPFRDAKVPFLFFSTGEHPDYHQTTDTVEKINFKQVAAISSLVFRVTQSVANADVPLEWVETLKPRMEEVRSVHRIAKQLLQAGRGGKLNTFQQFIVIQAEAQTRLILERGTMTAEERVGLIRTAQILLLSVF